MKFQKLFLLLYSLVVFGVSKASAQLNMNDVSILYPLPAIGSWNLLLQGQSQLATQPNQGELLPLNYLNQLPALTAFGSNEDLYNASLRVVSVRVDPCFHEGQTPVKCRPQIRLVWQPLIDLNEKTSTIDAALHTFYDLTSDQFQSLLVDLQNLKKTTLQNQDVDPRAMSPALTIQPIMAQLGLSSSYVQNFNQIILKYAGSKNLSRLTFMQLFMNGNIWDFGGFDILQNEMKPLGIARLDVSTQRFQNTAFPKPTWFRGKIAPEPQVADETLVFLVKDSRQVASQNETEIKQAVRAAVRFENPTLHNPGTVDCVSCHVAQSVRLWATRQFPWFQLDRLYESETYLSPQFDLSNKSGLMDQTNVLRGFGYFADQPITSQRVINESAEVVRSVNQYLFQAQ